MEERTWPISGHTPAEYVEPVSQGHHTSDTPARWKLVKEEITELDSGYIITHREFECVEILGDGTGELRYEYE